MSSSSGLGAGTSGREGSVLRCCERRFRDVGLATPTYGAGSAGSDGLWVRRDSLKSRWQDYGGGNYPSGGAGIQVGWSSGAFSGAFPVFPPT